MLRIFPQTTGRGLPVLFCGSENEAVRRVLMYVKQLRIENFRNIAHADLSFGKEYNILTGMNGQGKTNTIESIYLALSGKSHRETITENFIGDAGPNADVEVVTEYDDGTEHRVLLNLAGDRKYQIDGDPVRRRSELLRNFSVFYYFMHKAFS